MGNTESTEVEPKELPPKHGELLEYSVVYTDRTYNLMSQPFGDAYRDIQGIMKRVYGATTTVLIPGSGTFAMEAAARAFGKGKKCLIIRNGYFSFRWTQIMEAGEIPSQCSVIMARRTDSENTTRSPKFAPPTIAEVVEQIMNSKPDVVFAPHVETSTGIIIPDSYIKQVGEAVKSYGGIFVLDCIASGSSWVNMDELSVDVIIGAPQKAWSGPAGCGIVLLNDRARAYLLSDKAPKSSSFACDLKKWLEVSDKYKEGAFMYYTTFPTESIMKFRDTARETETLGFDVARARALELKEKVVEGFQSRGFVTVADPNFQASGVVVVYDTRKQEDAGNMMGQMKSAGFQIAGPVAFMLGPSSEGLLPTFRIGLFGLDKWENVDRTASLLFSGIDKLKSRV